MHRPGYTRFKRAARGEPQDGARPVAHANRVQPLVGPPEFNAAVADFLTSWGVAMEGYPGRVCGSTSVQLPNKPRRRPERPRVSLHSRARFALERRQVSIPLAKPNGICATLPSPPGNPLILRHGSAGPALRSIAGERLRRCASRALLIQSARLVKCMRLGGCAPRMSRWQPQHSDAEQPAKKVCHRHHGPPDVGSRSGGLLAAVAVAAVGP